MTMIKLFATGKLKKFSNFPKYFSTKPNIKQQVKRIPKEIEGYLRSQNNLKLLEVLPAKLLRKTYKIPSNLYVISKSTAKTIANIVTSDLPQNLPLAEIYPGPGILTRYLIGKDISKLLLYESDDAFTPDLQELHALYPDRIKVKKGDFVSLWKMNYQDKQNNGTKLMDFLSDVPKTDYTGDVNMRLVGAIGCYNFFKHLINCLVFQHSLLSYGRSEMFLILPPPLYIHLTGSREMGYLLYRSTSVLFQIMFEYKFIRTLPREHFLPWQHQQNSSSHKKLTKVNSINPEFFYLVKIVPRRNLYDLCPIEDMPALWYFIKQNMISRKNRVIPNLEQWIPGCGARLIINLNKSESIEQLYPDEDPQTLPPLSTPCTTMSTRDYFPGMNIFTEIGDLTPSQILSLFCQFRNFPEYKDSLFLASLDNTMLKLETTGEEHVDGIDIVEEDDASIESSKDLLNDELEPKRAPRKRKTD